MSRDGSLTKRAAIAPLGIAAVGAALFAVELTTDPRGALYAYLAAFAFVASTTLGALSLVMMAHATGARWFVVLRRLSEAIAATLPLLVVFFIPTAVTLPRVYPWAGSFATLREDVRAAIEHAQPWMSAPWFLARTVVYLAVFIAFSELLRRASLDEDRGGVGAHERQKRLSGAGIPILGFVGSFAAFDWIMSAVPGWNYNILGAYVLIGGFGSSVGVTAVLLHRARRPGLLPPEVGSAHAHAVGRLLLLSVCLWTYLAAAALIIVWSADIPREAEFYVVRTAEPWRALEFVLFAGHFAVPFVLLLVRSFKRSAAFVGAMGAWLVLMHAVDMYWLLVPAAGRGMRVLDVGPFLLLSGLTAAFGALRFNRAPPVPLRDPDLERSLAYESP